MRAALLALLGLITGCTPATSPPPADLTTPPPVASASDPVPVRAVASTRPEPVPAPRPEPEPEPEEEATVATAGTAPTTAGPRSAVPIAPILDPRRARPRAPSLLRTEIAGLKRLFAATPQSSPDRPALLRRLASDCVELRKAGDPSGSAAAIAYYTTLVRDHPNTPHIDEDRYFLALEDLQAGDLPKARAAFFDLIRNSPSSKYVPYAYFAFAEAFFDEARSDPSKYDLAKQAYTKVLQFAQSPVAPEAALRVYQVAKATGDPTLAAKMRALLRSQYPSSPAASRVP